MVSFTEVALYILLVVVLIACKKEPRNLSITIQNSDTYVYRTGMAGEEEGASIKVQASQFERSEIVRADSTNYEAVYYYKPTAGFVGEDEVILKMVSYPTGTPMGGVRRWTKRLCFTVVQ